MTSEPSAAAEGGNGAGTGTGSAGGSSGNVSSQRSSLPWAQVVRGGGEPDPVAPRSPSASPPSVLPEQKLVSSDQLTVIEPPTTATVENHPDGSEGSSNCNASGVQKSVWNKPSPNGVVEGSSTPPVMGAASWPALSELTRPLPKSLSSSAESSSKSTPDASVTISQAAIIPHPPHKHVKPNSSNHSNQNHNHTIRQKSMNRGGASGAGGGYNRQPPPPPPPMPPYPLFDISYGGFVPAVRDQSPYSGNTFIPRPMGGSHMHDSSSNRKRNYVNNGGHRRDHHGLRVPPPPPPPRGYIQPPHMGPIRPYGAPVGYEMPIVYVPTLPPGGPPLPPYIPVINMPPSLSDLIKQQIEYYFSDVNLMKDNYLKLNMDAEGWVPVTLIAGFRRVQSLTSDIQMILTSLLDSTFVEVQGEAIRRRNDWRKWVNLSQPPTDDDSAIETSLQKIVLDEFVTDTRNKEEANGELTPGNQFTSLESSYQDQ